MTKIGMINSCNLKTSQLNNKNNNIHFKGSLSGKAIDALSSSMEKFERGGFLAEFLFVDFCGLLIPRTLQALYRNHDKLGHLNLKAATEEFLREILSGPSMILIPMVSLALASKKFGSSANVPLKSLNAFKGYHQSSLKDYVNNAANFDHKEARTKFLKNIFEDAFSEHLKVNKGVSKEIDEIVDVINRNIENQSTKTGFSLKNIMEKRKLTNQLKDIVVEKISIINESCNIRQNTRTLSINGGDGKKVSLSASAIFDDLTNYASDTVKKVNNVVFDNIDNVKGKTTKLIKKVINDTHITKIGVRKGVVAIGLLATSLFLWATPKMYQRYKKYPGLEGLEDNNISSSKTPSKGLTFQNTLNQNKTDYFKLLASKGGAK